MLDRLDDPRSREAETTWMWEQTLRRFDATVGVRARDDHVLEVELARPTAYFLDLVCFGVCYPVNRPCVEGWDQSGMDEERLLERGWIAVTPPPWERRRWVDLNPATGRLEQMHQWARPGLLVSNGPYVLTEWRYKRDMRLRANELYHTPDRVKPEDVVALTIDDPNTRVLAFESGQIDWLSDVGAEYEADMIAQRLNYERRYADRIEAGLAAGLSLDEALAGLPEPGPGERRNIHAFPTFGTDFYSFNCRPRLGDGRLNPFAEAKVRRAFVMAVNRQTIVEQVTRLREPVLTTLIPPDSIPGYDGPVGLGFDPGKAREELAEAGWRDRNDDGLVENEAREPFPVIDLLWTTNTPRYKWISLELKAQWERELGVRVELRGSDTKFYKEDLKQGKFMIARGRWYGDYGDPTTFLDLCKTGDGNNDRGYSNPEVDRLLEEASLEPDPARRMGLLEQCEDLLFGQERGEVPMLVICQLVQVYMYEPGALSGLSQHPRLTQYVWQMEVTR
jgi:oligopeptide transport system substrate-binding protein